MVSQRISMCGDKYDIEIKIVAQVEDKSLTHVEHCVDTWHMPDDYKQLDIIELFDMCNTEEQRKRVLLELNLFMVTCMIIVLQFLKYHQLDVCKEHNIV